MTDPQTIPLREWLGDRFKAIDERFDEQQRLLVGNGRPGLLQDTAVNRAAIERLDAGFATLAKEVRETRNVKKVGKWGGIAGAVSALAYFAAVLAAVFTGQQPPRP